MKKDEYNKILQSVLSAKKELDDKLLEAEKAYIAANAMFELGERVEVIDNYDRPRYGYVSEIRVFTANIGGDFFYDLVVEKKDGTRGVKPIYGHAKKITS